MTREVGARIRALREARGLSLSALAAEAGIGKGSLSELETGQRNPTLDTLYAVATPLGVPLAALLDDHDGTVISGAGVVATRVRVLREAERTTEVYLLRLAPGAVRTSPAHAGGVEEQLVVLAGTGTVRYDDRAVALAAGDHVRFAADRPHSYEAGPDAVLEAVNIIVTPA
ncbi:XRE family transcriptional regulator [Nocardioides sp. WV_118_6]|uniref:helix-turn-helix domain-containing protein n=1 Tax=Nocardioides simplex TaxID=2045 RepID=UPI00214F8F74|nr:XRE family transcriptional regulator [Pimelobacter simplex]UUW89634.1 XRE family transcriptional regulator [Pimelobacter simplex]UUW93463.1 XRE family transcriptional regulator [Pimelobacter simplex]